MEVSLTTPALLFPALSLLLLAYTNRFLALASLIRSLHASFQANPATVLLAQIDNLQRRVILIRNMQATGISSLFLCVASMLLMLARVPWLGWWVFATSLVLLLVSLGMSLREILISVNAIRLHLSDIERPSLNGREPSGPSS